MPNNGTAHHTNSGDDIHALDKALGSKVSRREAEVADLVVQGLQDKEIAAVLCITPGTVEQHISHLKQRLGVRNRVLLALAWDRVHPQ